MSEGTLQSTRLIHHAHVRTIMESPSLKEGSAPDGSSVEARALIDNASTSSFVSERLVQLRRSHLNISVSGIAGSVHNSSLQSVAQLQISSAYSRNRRKIDLTAVILPKVACNLPVVPIPFGPSWSHLVGLPLADPAFGEPGRIDTPTRSRHLC